jgi:RNA polymerase sigma-B factor
MPLTSPDRMDVRPGDDEAVEQVEEWFRLYHATRSPAVRERIILAHLGLADRLAARIGARRGISYEDLVQTARVGLVNAVDRYDPGRPNPFIAYAVVCISGELRRFLRDSSWRLHIPRSWKERALEVVRARDRLTGTLGRSPTLTEIAAHLGIREDAVMEALEAVSSLSVLSLDQPIDQRGDADLGSIVSAPAGDVEVEDLLVLPELVSSLPEVERRAVMLRFFDELTQDEIGATLGCSQMHVSRLLRRAVTRMRNHLLG